MTDDLDWPRIRGAADHHNPIPENLTREEARLARQHLEAKDSHSIADSLRSRALLNLSLGVK